MTPQPTSLQRLFDVVEYLVDERVGIVRDVIEPKREAGAPNLFCFYAKACNTEAFSNQKNFPDTAGVSTDRGAAMAKAIGEAVERYCAALYEADELPFYSYDSAPFPCVCPSQFALYSPRQYEQEDFPYCPFTNDRPVRWTPAVDLATGESIYVPAAMVFVPYFYDPEIEEFPIVQPLSTGLACHCSQSEAAISAIGEVIERDAFTIMWQARLSMPQLLVESLSESNKDLVERYRITGASVVLLNITMDHGIPTILSVLRNDAPDAPALIFAAAAHLDPEVAIRKSLEELEQTRGVAQYLKTHRPPLVPGADFENVINQESHIRLVCDQTTARLADFVFASKEQIDFKDIQNLSKGEPEQDLKQLVEKVRRVNLQVLLADVTTPDVHDLGLSVVRAIIPGFHPLFFGHRLRPLGGTRLWQVPQKLGYVGITPESGDNPVPHPYP